MIHFGGTNHVCVKAPLMRVPSLPRLRSMMALFFDGFGRTKNADDLKLKGKMILGD